MMLYRSLVVGLLGAIAMLTAARPIVAPATAPAAAVVAPAPEPVGADEPRQTVVDAIGGFRGAATLLALTAREQIVSIDDQPCDACEVELEQAWGRAIDHGYVDVTIQGPDGWRRVLLLAHRLPAPQN